MKALLKFKAAMINTHPLLIIIVIFLQLGISQESHNFVPYRRFSVYRDPLAGPHRGNASVQFSLSDCAMQCLDDFRDECHAFMFNDVTKLCTTGSFLSMSAAVPSSAEGRLYISDDQMNCDIGSGYEILSLDNNYYCVFFSSNKLKWLDAKQFCEDDGGYLAFVDSLAEARLFDQHFKSLFGHPAYLWIGLSDRDVENTFVWTHDGSVMTLEKVTELFKPGNPDDWRGEDCVQIQGNYINDDDCDTSRFHVCQKPFTISA